MRKMKIGIKFISQLFSFIVLLIISSILGFMRLPTEMGLAIAAGALGLVFSNLDKFSRFKGAGFEAEMKMVHTMIESQTELTPEERSEVKTNKITNEEFLILKSLQKPGYTWRYAKTVSNEANSTLEKTEGYLASLKSRGYVGKGLGSNGEIWTLTTRGKSIKEEHEHFNS
jgi:hypothetical protein